LSEVIARLNAFYGQRIELKVRDIHTQNLPITVTFTEEDLPAILDVVAATLNLKVSHKENNYVIEQNQL
jgi:ferric-dicitrate binding protein FerR (iron transport regulator)